MSTQRALIINGSPRKHGNTAWVSDRVFEMFQNKGIETTMVSAAQLKSLNNGCIGCKGCQASKEYLCVFKDDVQPVVASMPQYQYVIFATPIYFFGPTAQTKLVLDRMYSLMKANEDGSFRHPFKGTKFGLVLTSGGPEDHGCDLTAEMFRRTAGYFGDAFEKLVVTECFYVPEEYDEKEEKRIRDKATEFFTALIGYTGSV